MGDTRRKEREEGNKIAKVLPNTRRKTLGRYGPTGKPKPPSMIGHEQSILRQNWARSP